jgi:hypothetical protein
VKPWLLSQVPVAGVGNIYADESLWRARIHPAQTRLTPDEARRLHAAIREVLAEAVLVGGSTLSDHTYAQPDGTPGGFQTSHHVYAREGHACARCGGAIVKTVLAARGTHFCPACQPAAPAEPAHRGGVMTDLTRLRVDYEQGELRRADLHPIRWSSFASGSTRRSPPGCPEPYAMTVATADADGQPSARTVLLRGFDSRGFVFYTNYLSQKGREVEVNPRAALLFYWPGLERQVRVEGTVEFPVRRRVRRLLRLPGPARVSSARTPAPRVRSCGTAPNSRSVCTRPSGPSRARCRARRTGAGTASARTCWSSGRAARAVCTTASGTPTTRRAGRSTA